MSRSALEDLETIKKPYIHCDNINEFLYVYTPEISNIEKTLKEYEELQNKYDELFNSKVEMSFIYARKLKALEIIKLKQVNVYSFIQKNPKTFEEYQDIDDEIEQLSEVSLSKEDFNLLKEVLLNE